MQNIFIDHPQNLYSTCLKSIGGKDFTAREADIIACIVCKRSATIPSFLSISPKTVSAHISSILQKISGNCREDIISFAEKSNQYSLVKKYYESLVVYFSFEAFLSKKVKGAYLKNKPANTRSQSKEGRIFIKELEKHLILSGIKASHGGENTFDNLLRSIQDKNLCHIVTVSSKEREYLREKTKRKILIIQDLYQQSSDTQLGDDLVLIYGEDSELNDFDCINFKECDNYYLGVFKLLKKLSPAIDWDKISEEFIQLVQTLVSTESAHSQREVNLPILPMQFFKKKSIYFFISIVLFISIVFLLKISLSKKEIKSKDHKIYTLRSELLIPTDSIFLKRPQITDQMDNTLKRIEKNDVQVLAIVGMGGSGKTTLARSYAKSHTFSVVWEVNAETKESLISSFKDLANGLAKTKKQKEELMFVNSIQNPDEKEKQILHLVQNYLKQHSNWLLIYDNAEGFSDIKTYFPQDPKVWGEGKLIITTKNSNIKNINSLNSSHVIYIDPLNQQESLTLFSKIYYNEESIRLSSEQKEKILEFLTKIPPFPLDVSIAAYYIKNTHITFEEYLERINQCSQDFEKNQVNLIKEISGYSKTRYGIISLSFQKLIESHPDFKELLFLICLLDSQNIPKNLLEHYKDSSVIDRFTHDLQGFSFITKDVFKENEDKIVTFSLHRSTQTFGQSYILSLLTAEEKKTFTDQIISTIQSFYKLHVEKKHSIIRSNLPHFQAFLENLQTVGLPKDLNEKYTQDFLFILGYAYKRCSRNLILEKQYLSQAYHLQHRTQLLSDERVATLLKDLAATNSDLECAEETITYAQESLKLCNKFPQSETLATENFVLLGNAHTHKNDFEKALFYFMEALKKSEHITSDSKNEIKSNIYASIGWLYSVTYITGDKALKAKEYVHKALEILKGETLVYNHSPSSQVKLSRYVPLHKTTLGDIYCRFGDYQEAITQGFKEALYIIDHSLNSSPHYLLRAYIAIGMGEAYLRIGHLENAKETLEDAISKIEAIAGKNTMLSLPSRIFC